MKMTGENLSSDSKRRHCIPFLIAIIAIPLATLFFSGLKLNTNILDLLPETGHSEHTEKAVKHFTEKVSSNSLYLIKSTNFEQTLKAAQTFENELIQSGLFSEIHGKKSDSEFKLWYELYFPHRYHLLTDRNRETLDEEGIDKFLTSRIKLLYSPQSSLYSSNLEQDPLMLFGDFIQELPSPGSFTIKEGYLYKEDEDSHLILLSARFKDSVFSSSVQDKFRNLLNKFTTEESNTEVLQLGFFPYAERARAQAEWEISFIGTGSIIGIILLFLLIFRSVSQLLITLSSIIAGVSWALLLTQSIFGNIHIITIVFGATLTGVCVDYAFHWFCHFRFGEKHKDDHVKKSILWGATTSFIAYSGLFFADFPGLKQIALFSSSGIIVSVACVLLLFPKYEPVSVDAPEIFKKFRDKFGASGKYISLTILILLSLIGYRNFSTNDDIRLLQNRPLDLVEQENEFRALLSPYDNSRFILVSAKNDEALLKKEQRIIKDLKAGENAIDDTLSISSMLPDLDQQKYDYRLISETVNSTEFANYCEELGFDEKVLVEAKKYVEDYKPLDLNNFLKHPAANQLKQLYIEDIKMPSSIILLKGINNDQKISMAVNNYENAQYIDKVRDTSAVMAEFKYDAVKLTFFAYLFIFFLLNFRLKTKKAIKIISPPVLAVIISCGILSLLGVSFNLFNILSLILILGIGIDYSIFYAFGENAPSTNIAVTLSTISTLLAFGLLAFSSTAALSTFGITLSLGIVMSYYLAPLSKN